MAKVREPQKPEHSQSESGEEEESSDESSEESESEPEPEQPQVPKKVSTPAKATQQKQNKESSQAIVPKKAQSSSEEIESGSESESDYDSDRQTLQKSMSGPKKPRSDVQATSAKRPASAAEEARDAKKAKKKKVDRPLKADPKPLFQRVWSEEDEIAILKGMIEYSNIQKKDPVADTGSFFDFIKEDLHVVGVTRTQLQDKIRRLRKKYENNKSRGIKTFSKGHEQKAYQLSKLIWGLDDLNDQDGGENAKAKATDEDEEAKDVSCKSQKWGFGMSVEDRIFRAGEVFFGGNNGVEAEEKWKKLKVDEVELYVKQLEVKLHQSRLVLSFLKS